MPPVSRRQLLTTTGGLALASSFIGTANGRQAATASKQPFGFCFNTSTIRGQRLPLTQQIDIAAEAGYQGIEPWIRDIRAHVEQGGTLRDLRRRIQDRGLTVESAIGFANWIVDDDAQRAAGLETAKSDMEVLREIGGKRIAAPPAGAQQQEGLNLFRAAERYAALLEVGAEMDVVPQAELWGHSKSISRLGELLFITSEAGHTNACMLPDVYHIYKGGSDFHGLQLIHGSRVHVFHMNDYPSDPPRPTIQDKHRVYPGDGVAPLTFILQTLYRNGFRGMLSLELFNPEYWQQDPLEVARHGLACMRAAVEAALPA